MKGRSGCEGVDERKVDARRWMKEKWMRGGG